MVDMTEKRGSALTDLCPRSGFIRLWTVAGMQITVPTACKTWGCLSCRDRVKNRIARMIEYGCLILGSCWLITLTFRKSESNPRTADSVNTAFRGLLSKLKKRPLFREMAWWKVIEATKKGQPHLHLVVGGISSSQTKRQIKNVISTAWYEMTGDSYIVDVTPVLGAKGAAAYLTKYLVKAMMSWDVLYQLGFRRRWSASNNWPRAVTEMAGTHDLRWVKSEFINGGTLEAKVARQEAESGTNSYLRDMVGDSVILDMAKRERRRGIASRLKKGVTGGHLR